MTAVLVLVATVLLAAVGIAMLVVGLHTHRAQRPQRPWPAPVLTRAQRRVAATRAWERGDPEATDVLPVVRDN